MSQNQGQRRFPRLIDTHCHLDDDSFDQDRASVMGRANLAGIEGIVVPGIMARHWPRILDLATANPHIYATLGLHPCFLHEHHEQDLDKLDSCFDHLSTAGERVVGIGECGLDYYIENPDKPKQLEYFEGQLSLARKFSFPIVIHARGAVEEVILTVRKSGHNCGVIHSYNGSLVQAKRLMDLGYLFSFGGAITHSRATKLRQLVADLPLDSLLLETDAPFQADAESTQERNEPARLVQVFETVCELRSESRTAIATATTANATRLFALDISTGICRRP